MCTLMLELFAFAAPYSVRFHSLAHLIDVAALARAYRRVRGRCAASAGDAGQTARALRIDPSSGQDAAVAVRATPGTSTIFSLLCSGSWARPGGFDSKAATLERRDENASAENTSLRAKLSLGVLEPSIWPLRNFESKRIERGSELTATTIPFGSRIHALPVHALWAAST